MDVLVIESLFCFLVSSSSIHRLSRSNMFRALRTYGFFITACPVGISSRAEFCFVLSRKITSLGDLELGDFAGLDSGLDS